MVVVLARLIGEFGGNGVALVLGLLLFVLARV